MSILNEYSTWMDVMRFAASQGDRDWVYIITGKPGPTGKTFLCNKLKYNGYNAYEISEDTGRSVKYFGDVNTFNINYEKKQVVIVLNKPIYKHGSTPWNGRKETGPAWDGFRAGVEEAERDIHGGFTKPITVNHNKIKDIHNEWIKKNPHTDISTLYPETHFVLPRSFGKVAFTKAWMNAVYGTPIYSIKNVIFNDPATIVFWTDGTKIVVKTQEGEIFDPEKGLAMAISKKALGNNREYYHTFLHWLKKYAKDNYATNELYHDAIRKLSKNVYKMDHIHSKGHDSVQLAYDILVKCRDHNVNFDIDDIIGYLGEALED